MFDIIGFWFGVSVYGFLTLLLPVMLVVCVLSLGIEKGIPDHDDSRKFNHWVSWGDGDNFYFFGDKIKINDLCMFGLVILSGCVAVYVLGDSNHNGRTLVEQVSLMSLGSVPLFKYVGLLVGSYLLLIKSTKYIYQAIKFKGRVEEHMKHEKS